MLPLWIITVVVGYFTIKWFLNRLEVGNIDDKYVFITGCDTGFGNALAKKLDGLGFHVIAACLTKDGASELKKVTSERLTTVVLDVTSTQDVKRVMEEIDEMIPASKGLWAIVNNAGISGSILPFDLTAKEDFEKVLSVNLLGLIDVCIKCVPLLRKGRTKGRVINVSSVAGRFALGGSAYVVSKYAVEGFSDGLRRELRCQGISVHIIEPGKYKSNIANKERLTKEIEHAYHRTSPDKRDYCGEEYIKKYSDSLTNYLCNGNPNLEPVVSAMTHAVMSRFPNRRYLVGLDAKYIFRVLWTLPVCISDFLFCLIIIPPRGAK
ncbi:short-chain dehydrogenase/reductase family 9C member 7 [Patella vulgata]|uniref:short-chain dehydrogenase/reductase family 9C member 7 n=1 Tax=Patella vulgata TaxID=6465 RepID=UPI00217FC83B|nr:short-chain dehydrogenase/reductase family 9C member 7 [Patella vulgata]